MTRVKIFLFLLSFTAVGTLLEIYHPHYFTLLNVSTWNNFSTAFFSKTPSPHLIIVIPTNSTTTTKKPRLCFCENCLTEDQGLRKDRLDTFVEPLLSKNYKLSQDNYNWWRVSGSSAQTYHEVLERLFQLFPPVPDIAEPKSDKCRTCAVVGNSPRLRGANYGEIIDSKDVVIRINNGQVHGFEKDVGTKTTHRAMYPESAQNLDNSTHLLLFAFKMLDLQWLLEASTTGFNGRSYAPIISRINANKNLVMVVNPAFMRYVHDKWLARKASYPSTGIMTVVLALYICDEVHVFGFGADTKGHWSHYWEPQSKTPVNSVHPGSFEYSIIEQLDKQGRLKFHKGI
uniref:CMP-N-acetylneuraminate-beta-galactosamide-alpha-2,3-sialyltransferase 1 n=1 Tax=Gouania willdenowi TaxID=441366 RepID=A0A8C5D8E1_GOUWI